MKNTLLKSPKAVLEKNHVITHENLQLETSSNSKDSTVLGLCRNEFNLHQMCKSLGFFFLPLNVI